MFGHSPMGQLPVNPSRPANRSAALAICLALILSACATGGRQLMPTPATSGVTQQITILTPSNGDSVTSPIKVSGTVTVQPFERSLTYRLFGPEGTLLAQGSFTTDGPDDGPGKFSGSIAYALDRPGPGRLEVVEVDAADGTVRAVASVMISLRPGSAPLSGLATTPVGRQAIVIDTPTPGTMVGSPVVITGRTTVIPSGNQLSYTFRDAAGALLGSGSFPVTATAEGGGIFNASLTFNPPSGGGNVVLEVFEPGTGDAPLVASTTLNLTVGPPPGITPTPSPTPQAITIETPPPDTVVGSPVVITGRAILPPRSGELYYVIRTPERETLGQGSFPVRVVPGQTANAPFVASIIFAEPRHGGAIIAEVYDRDEAGRIIAAASVRLQVQPRSAPIPTPTPATATSEQNEVQRITITAPITDTLVGSPMIIDGLLAIPPYQSRLDYRVTDAANRELGAGDFFVALPRTLDGPVAFSGQITFTLPAQGGPITVTLFDRDESKGVIRAEASVRLQVAPQPSPPPP